MDRMKIFAAAIVSVCLFATGCSQQTINSAANDTKHDAAVIGKEAEKVGQEVKPAAEQLNKQTKPALDKLGLGARVTAALQSNANLPHTIRVDAGANGVRLRGTVQTAQQKTLAGNVAKQTVPAGKTVQNELTISPKPAG